jgi:Skp family chaperone for outer membrane proteins
MRFTLVLLLALTVTPMTSFAYGNKTVIEVYQEAIQKLTFEYDKLKQLTTQLEKEANSIKTLIADYEKALKTTTEALEKKHEAQLKTVKDAYRKKLAAEADLAELARKSAEDNDKATRALLDELGTSAEKVAKLTDAVNVSEADNVGIGTTTPGAKLDVAGNLIRTIAYATGNGPGDDTDVGQIKSRVLRFNKAKTSTKIRISYTDALRTWGTQKGCRWEIRLDGHSCPNQALVYDDYAWKEDNTHTSRTVVGYCSGVAAGSHTIGIWVGNTPGYSGSDCYTGWKNSTWVIEAEEVN